MLKVCLVGVGGISGAHIPAWNAMEDVTLAGICDIRPERFEPYPDVPHYTDFDAMLDAEKPDILDICLPTYLHVEYTLKALRRGIHVVCEKPISLHKDDVDLVYKTAAENGVNVMIAQVLRFWREYDFLKTAYETRRYGRLLSGTMTRLGTRPRWSWDGWMTDESRSGFVPFDLHIHDLDFLVYAFGAPKNSTVHRVRRDDSDYFHALYEFDGFFVDAAASWYDSDYPFSAGYRFQFENAVIEYVGGKLTVYNHDGSEEIGGASFDPALTANAYANELRYFADCVRDSKTPDTVRPGELKTVLGILA